MPCKLFDQISGKIHRDKDLYDLISLIRWYSKRDDDICVIVRFIIGKNFFFEIKRELERISLSLFLSVRGRLRNQERA